MNGKTHSEKHAILNSHDLPTLASSFMPIFNYVQSVTHMSINPISMQLTEYFLSIPPSSTLDVSFLRTADVSCVYLSKQIGL